MPNFQGIIDIFSQALSILDFSHIISGTATFLIVIFVLHIYGIHLSLDTPTWTAIICIALAYIAGLLSWIIGAFLRGKIHRIDDEFHAEFLKIIDIIGLSDIVGIGPSVLTDAPSDLQKERNKVIYSYMWIQLAKVCPERTAFINRFWVMQAMFEGLSTSCLVGLIATVVLSFYYYSQYPFSLISLMLVFLVTALLVFFYLSTLYAARKQANTQINEVVLAYKIYCVPSNN